MIDQQAIKRLEPEARLTQLKELAEERKRELLLIEQMLKETTAELRQATADAEVSFARQLVESAAIAETSLDARLEAAVAAAPEEMKQTLADVAKMMAGLYQTPAQTGEMDKAYQPQEEYSPFKQAGYESLWQQKDDAKFKRHEDKKEERNLSLP